MAWEVWSEQERDVSVLIARLIADPETLGDNLARATAQIEEAGAEVAGAGMLDFCESVLEMEVVGGDAATVRGILDACFPACDFLLSDRVIETPRLFVSDMDSTMISAECIDELADFAGLKDRIAAITERAMQGELDFESALRERVGLLKDLPEAAITQCLDERIRPMPGARTLVSTLKSRGCHTVLVTALGQRVDWLTLHQGLFIVWAVLTGLHLLARLVPALQLTVMAKHATTTVDGKRLRTTVLIGSLAIAVVSAVLVLAGSGSWRGGERHGPHRPPGQLGVSIQR